MFKLSLSISRLLCGVGALALAAMLTLTACPAGTTGGGGKVHGTMPAKKAGGTAGSSATTSGKGSATDPSKPRTDVDLDNPNTRKVTAPKPDTNKKPGPAKVPAPPAAKR